MGGLTWNTTKEMLHIEFSKYGEIVDSIVMKNPETGNSRGFGFVTYKDNSSAENAVNSGSHKIDGKIVVFVFLFFFYQFGITEYFFQGRC